MQRSPRVSRQIKPRNNQIAENISGEHQETTDLNPSPRTLLSSAWPMVVIVIFRCNMDKNKMIQILFWAGMTTVALLLNSCAGAPVTSTGRESPLNPVNEESLNSRSNTELELKITILPDTVSEERAEQIAMLQTYLMDALELPIIIIESTSYDDTVKNIVDGTANVAYLGPLTYIKAKAQNQTIEPLVAPIDKLSGRPWYTSVVVGRKDIDSLYGLRGRLFSFVNDASTSGFLVPYHAMRTLGLIPEMDFASVEYSGAHDTNLDWLVSGRVEAIAVDYATYQTGLDSGVLDLEKFHIIWESDPIPNSPITASGAVPQATKRALRRALIDAPDGLVSVGVTDTQGYTTVEDGDYDLIRKLYESQL